MINRATPPRGIAPHCRSRLGPGEYYCPKSLKLLFRMSNRLGYCKIYLSSSKESTVEINQCYKGKKEFKEIFVWIPWIMVTMTRTIPYGLQLYYLATLIPMLDVNQTQHNANTNNFDCQPRLSWIFTPPRPQRWSIFQSDGMVNVFFQATIDFNGLSMVLTLLHHRHWMFFEGPTIGVNGFSMGNGQRWFWG